MILELLGAGTSRRAAAAAAGIDHATLLRWLRRGEKAAPGGRWRAFYDAVLVAEADPGLGALGMVEYPFDGDPWAAMRFLESSEPEVWGKRRAPESTGPVVVQLSLSDPPRALPGDEKR